MRVYRLVVISVLLMLVTGCATNAMTGRKQLAFVSEKSVIQQSDSMYLSLVDGYEKKGKISKDPAVNERVRTITNRLVHRAIEYRPETADWNWQVNVIEDDTPNAFCMPGGKMGVNTGLLEKIQPSDDELAQVMGHEISHALANHGAEKMSNQILGQIIVGTVAVVAAAADSNNGRYNQQTQRVVQDVAVVGAAAFITLPNSRTAETEADKMGVEIAAQAGYDPAAAISIWEKMMNATGQQSRGDFWSTHPSPPNRIDAFKALQDPMQQIYAQTKASYTADNQASYNFVKMGTDPLANSSNVRVVSSEGASNSLVPPTAVIKPRIFYSAEYAAFKQGTLELTCVNCGLSNMMSNSTINEYLQKEDWRRLMQTLVKVNHKSDLSYYHLGLAAEGMGHKEAARIYFEKARELFHGQEFSCATAKMNKCKDLSIAELVEVKLLEVKPLDQEQLLTEK
jgi:Zn-dependent protease with chaperone function